MKKVYIVEAVYDDFDDHHSRPLMSFTSKKRADYWETRLGTLFDKIVEVYSKKGYKQYENAFISVQAMGHHPHRKKDTYETWVEWCVKREYWSFCVVETFLQESEKCQNLPK